MTDLQKAEYITNQCEASNINLCNTFEEWTQTAMALAELGEDGRGLFHRLASVDERYKFSENEKKFTNCLRTTKSVGIGSLVHSAKQNGVTLPHEAHEYKAAAKTTARRTQRTQQPQKVNILPQEGITPYLRNGHTNPLIQGLIKIFGADKTQKAVEAYRVGSSPTGTKAAFFQIDTQGRCRAGKVIAYKADLHRDKTAQASWTHAERHIKGFSVTQCLFGEHLLQNSPGKVVAVVESEKTALICSIVFPEVVWLATGGKGQFKPDILQVLKGRKVCIFPDADAYTDWQTIAEGVRSTFASCVVSDWYKDEPEGSKRDIADLILEQLHNEKENN